LSEGWQLAGEWAAAWLDQHSDPTVNDLGKLFVDFSPPPSYPEVYDPNKPELYAMSGSATRIAKDTFVVTVGYGGYSPPEASSFFVVARGGDHHYQTKWSIKPLAERHFHLKDELGLWAFLDSCAYYCGPLVVDKVLPLASTESGEPRFAIDAYQSTNGSTLMKQFSVWRWNGSEARSLIIRSYRLGVDEDRDIQLVGNLLSIPTKEVTMSFSSFGCCSEPRGIWILHIDPDKVEDLGHRFLQPQILWVDRLLAASRVKSPAAVGLAATSVLTCLKGAEIDVFEIDHCTVLSRGKKGAFEISFGEGAKLWLAYRLRNGQPYFTDVRFE
jgi:hypothetical protein